MTMTSFTRLLKTLLVMEDAPRTGHVGVPIKDRVDLFLLAKYGANRKFTAEQRADARARVLDAMAGDIARQIANKKAGQRAEATDSASAASAEASDSLIHGQPHQDPAKKEPAADQADAFRKVGWKVGTGAPVTARRKKPRDPGPMFPIPTASGSSGIGLRANKHGNTETASALGRPYKDEVVIGDRIFSAYVDVSPDGEIILRGDFDKAWTKIVLFGNDDDPHPLEPVTGFDDARRCVGVGRQLFSDALEAARQDPAAIVLK
jgi:hypothetical protein